MKRALCWMTILLAVGVGAWAAQSGNGASQPASKPTKGAAPQAGMSDDDMRLEGEKRFRTNCGRCHQPPHKFPPRMMATIIRHMRVRSMITEEDMKYILRYMTQ